MPKRDPRIDAYIAKAGLFAQPVLIHLRELIHKVCPEAEETIKWSFPHFVYKGEILCSMASFKNHCAFGFYKASLMNDKSLIENSPNENAAWQLGRLTSLKDLPPDKKLISYIKEAMKLNEEGIRLKQTSSNERKELVVPDYFTNELNKNNKALKVFEEFSYTNKKEYIDWITEAKTETTREKRLMTAIEWISEGKPRNWKYIKPRK